MHNDRNYAELVDWIRGQCASLAKVQAVVLCGSRARGTEDPVSDLDLVVVIQGSTKYLQWGTWDGIATEVMYVPETMLNGARPGLFVGRKILWRCDDFDVNRVPDPKEDVAVNKEWVGYTAWDLRHALQVLGHQLQQRDIAAFWYGIGLWIPLAVRYILETQNVAIPTQRRQWSLLASVAPDTAARFSTLYALKDPDLVFHEMVHILDSHLEVAPLQPIADSPMVAWNSVRARAVAVKIRRLSGQQAPVIGEYWQQHWGSSEVVSRELRHVPQDVTGWVAEDEWGAILGMVTVKEGAEWEVVSLDSDRPGKGIGSGLLQMVEGTARQNGVRRLWLITSNDNLDALGFYQRRGWDLVAVHRGAIDRARRLKPEIPVTGLSGIALHHEIELEKILD